MKNLHKMLGIGGLALILSCEWENRRKRIPFPKEKILTISARDYCENQGKKLSEYKMKGVTSNRFWFGYLIPKDTEVVVDFRGSELIEGTALIPIKKYDNKENDK